MYSEHPEYGPLLECLKQSDDDSNTASGNNEKADLTIARLSSLSLDNSQAGESPQSDRTFGSASGISPTEKVEDAIQVSSIESQYTSKFNCFWKMEANGHMLQAKQGSPPFTSPGDMRRVHSRDAGMLSTALECPVLSEIDEIFAVPRLLNLMEWKR